MTVGTIRPIALSRLSQEFLSVMISRRCHSALYGCLVHDFLPEVSHGSLARVQVPARHSRCGASKALRARGSPPSHSILLDLNSSQMVQGISTIYTYDSETFRLVHLLTSRNAIAFPDDCPQPAPTGWPGCQIQNLSYTYDPAGNITHIRDDAQQTIYFRNKRVEP